MPEKNIRRIVSWGFVLLCVVGIPASPQAESFLRGEVTAVYDGDTLRVKFSSGSEKKIRLIGIDTPEMDDEREDVRYRAFLAKRFAFFHLYRKTVVLEMDWQPEDEYGRILAYVWWDEKMFNEFILRKGYAAAFLKYPFRQDYRRRFIAARDQARQESAGYWSAEPYPEVALDELERHMGKLVSVRFSCRTRIRGRYVHLSDPEARISAVLPVTTSSDFTDLKNSDGRVVRISGFLEAYRGRPQIMLAFPRQLEVIR